MSPEARFERELEQLRHDSNAAIQFLYAWISFHACAGIDAKIRRGINLTPLFWNTSLGALQTSLFIALGRIFDRNPKSHSLDRLLREAIQHPTIFSKMALAKRKAKQSPGATWINGYVKDAHIPSRTDFRHLRGTRRRRERFTKRHTRRFDTRSLHIVVSFLGRSLMSCSPRQTFMSCSDLRYP